MSSKIRIEVTVPEGKEVVVKQHTPEIKVGRRATPATSSVLVSFKKGKGGIDTTIDGHAYLTVEEFDHNDH